LLEPESRHLHRCGVAARQNATRPHDVRTAARINRPVRNCTAKRYRLGNFTAPPGNLFRGGGRSFGPPPRATRPLMTKKVRALDSKQALSARRGGPRWHHCARQGERKGREDRHAAEEFRQDRVTSALIIDGAELEANFAIAARKIPDIDVLPGAKEST